MATQVEKNLYSVDLGEEVSLANQTYVVLAGCGASWGRWACLTHGDTFRHNLAKDSHLGEPGQHTLAWVCPEHGLEVP